MKLVFCCPYISANNRVTINGMQVKTKVSSNLLVAPTNSEASFTKSLTQERAALLEPVSTINGTSFFYHANNNIDGSGKASDQVYTSYSESVELSNTVAGKTHVDYAFNERYTIAGTGEEAGSGTAQEKWLSKIQAADMSGLVAPAYGYVDYTFYLKATSSQDSSALNLTTLNLMYDDSALTGDSLAGKAWRVAVFKESVSAGQLGSAVGSMTLVSIMTLENAANSYAGTAASSTSARASVTYNAAPTIDSNIDAGETEYYKVVARLWLEGEDTTCNNETYALLTDSWKLELEFKLDTTSDPADYITTSSTIIS